jgi:hypothetical protein
MRSSLPPPFCRFTAARLLAAGPLALGCRASGPHRSLSGVGVLFLELGSRANTAPDVPGALANYRASRLVVPASEIRLRHFFEERFQILGVLLFHLEDVLDHLARGRIVGTDPAHDFCV